MVPYFFVVIYTSDHEGFFPSRAFSVPDVPLVFPGEAESSGHLYNVFLFCFPRHVKTGSLLRLVRPPFNF